MFMKLSVLLSVTLFFFFPASAISCEFKVGYDESNPFHYSDEQGLVVGSDADILREATLPVACDLAFVKLPWSRTLSGVEQGTVDIAIGAKHTKERAAFAYYSVPYKVIQHWFYTMADQHEDVDSLSGFFLKGKQLGIVRGWGYPPEIAIQINNQKNKNNIVEVNTFEQLPEMLERGRIDGMIASPSNLKNYTDKTKAIDLFVVRARYQEPLHFLFSKKSAPRDVVLDFNKELSTLLNKGRVEAIIESYLQSQ